MSIVWKIEDYAVLDSTQDLLKAYAAQGRPEGAVVQAFAQECGRGRHGRVWDGGPGNLFLSVLLRPGCAAGKIGQLSLCAGVAVAAAIRPYLADPGALSLKWPNDVLLDGKKCAGILPETGLDADGRVDWVALGIGVNVKTAPPDIGAAVEDFSPQRVELQEFRDALLSALGAYYGRWQAQGFTAIREEWLALGHRKGDLLLVKPGEKTLSGYFETIDNDGTLFLCDGDGMLRKVSSGDVYTI